MRRIHGLGATLAGLAGLATCWTASVLPETVGETRIVYRRSVPIEAWTGVVSVRQIEEAVVDVPQDCAKPQKGSPGCRAGHRFPRIYALDFRLERRVSADGLTRIELEERGSAFLLLHFDGADRRAFDGELTSTLTALSADAFSEEFAGLKPGKGPFSEIARRSVEPSWSCFANGTSRRVARYDRTTEERPDGSVVVRGSGVTGYGDSEIGQRLCDDVAAVVHPSMSSEELRTMPVARSLREETVEVSIADGLRASSFPDELVALPPDLIYTLERDPGVTQSASVHTSSDDSFTRATFTEDEMKFTAATRPIELPLEQVTTNAWLAGWAVVRTEREMGPAPVDRVVERYGLSVALLPTAPPADVDSEPALALEASETYRVNLDVDAFLAEIGSRLDRTAILDADAIEAVIVDRPAGLRSRGWLMTVCREDGSARYGLLPTRARSPVTNAGAFCDAVASSLASAHR